MFRTMRLSHNHYRNHRPQSTKLIFFSRYSVDRNQFHWVFFALSGRSECPCYTRLTINHYKDFNPGRPTPQADSLVQSHSSKIFKDLATTFIFHLDRSYFNFFSVYTFEFRNTTKCYSWNNSYKHFLLLQFTCHKIFQHVKTTGNSKY